MSDTTKYIASLVLCALCVTTVSAQVEQPDSLDDKDEVQVAFRLIPSKDVIGGSFSPEYGTAPKEKL